MGLEGTGFVTEVKQGLSEALNMSVTCRDKYRARKWESGKGAPERKEAMLFPDNQGKFAVLGETLITALCNTVRGKCP